MPIMSFGDTEIIYTLRRSETAKRARITVTPDDVEVVVPVTATEEQIAGVLKRRRAWLLKQTRQVSAKVAAAPVVARFVTGAKIPFRGRLEKIRVEPTNDTLVEVSYRHGFVVGLPRSASAKSADPLIESAVRLWLRKRVRQDVALFVKQHGEPNGLNPKGVHVKEQEHLWGSCGTDRIVNLNWQLVFAPKTVLEYAVVHELCHLRHRTHDEGFWRLVGTIIPDWQTRKSWLERNEHLLKLWRGETAVENDDTTMLSP